MATPEQVTAVEGAFNAYAKSYADFVKTHDTNALVGAESRLERLLESSGYDQYRGDIESQ